MVVPLTTVQRLLAKRLPPSLRTLTLPKVTEPAVIAHVKAHFDKLQAALTVHTDECEHPGLSLYCHVGCCVISDSNSITAGFALVTVFLCFSGNDGLGSVASFVLGCKFSVDSDFLLFAVRRLPVISNER